MGKKTCPLKENGGMRIINLRIQNKALLTKWIWIAHTKAQSNWAVVLRLLYDIQDYDMIGKRMTNPSS